ncbi:hypothetical protein MMC10_004097 [Thelotrema lepadinum]|nr:hypothetical protein [Thelotrema lepadinum]
MLSKIELSHIPPGLSVYVGLYSDVENAAFLRKQLLDQNSDFEFAFLDARSILSTTHVLAAVFRAINDMSNGRMKSRNVHSEIVFAFNSNNNISEAYRKFGILDDTKSLLVIKVTESDPIVYQELVQRSVEGTPLEFNDANLATLSDEESIRKTYKLQAGSKASSKTSKTQPISGEARRDLEISILGLVALRGAT